MGSELARWLIALGVVAAAVGFVVLGMGMAYANPSDGQILLSEILMGGGVVAAVVGAVLYRVVDEPPSKRPPGPKRGSTT